MHMHVYMYCKHRSPVSVTLYFIRARVERGMRAWCADLWTVVPVRRRKLLVC